MRKAGNDWEQLILKYREEDVAANVSLCIMAAVEERSVCAAILSELDDIFALKGRTKSGTAVLALLPASFGKSCVEHRTDKTVGSHELLPTGSQPKKN